MNRITLTLSSRQVDRILDLLDADAKNQREYGEPEYAGQSISIWRLIQKQKASQ